MAWDGMGAFVRALEQRGELVRVARRVDPHLEVAAIADRVMKAGGPGAPLRGRRPARAFRSSSTRSARGGACRSRSASTTWKSTRAPSPSSSSHAGPVERRGSSRSSRSSCPSSRTSPRARRREGAVPGRRRRPATTSISTRSPSSRAGRATAAPSSRSRRSSRATPRRARATSAATACRSSTGAAPPCTGRCTRPARATSAARRSWACAASTSRSRSAATRRSRTRPRRRCPTGSTSGCSPASCASAPWPPSGARRSTSRSRPTPTSCSRGTSTRRRALVDEGPFGDHTGYYTPVDRFPRFHVTARHAPPDAVYPGHARGPAADGRRVARQGDRAPLPAAAPDALPRGRRHEPARRGRVPQPRARLDQEAVPLPRGAPRARPLGVGADVVLEGHLRRRRRRRRAERRAGRVAAAREPRPEARLRVRRRADRPARSRREPGALGRQGVHRRHAQVEGRGVHARVARALPR